MSDRLPGAPPFGALGRVAAGDGQHYCRFVHDIVELLDRPAWEPGVRLVGKAPLARVEMLAPAVPGKIIAVGLNYRAHAEEFEMAVPAEPILFMKPRTAVIGPGQTIVRPARSSRVDYEAELAVVVSRPCKRRLAG